MSICKSCRFFKHTWCDEGECTNEQSENYGETMWEWSHGCTVHPRRKNKRDAAKAIGLNPVAKAYTELMYGRSI